MISPELARALRPSAQSPVNLTNISQTDIIHTYIYIYGLWAFMNKFAKSTKARSYTRDVYHHISESGLSIETESMLAAYTSLRNIYRVITQADNDYDINGCNVFAFFISIQHNLPFSPSPSSLSSRPRQGENFLRSRTSGICLQTRLPFGNTIDRPRTRHIYPP